MLIGHLDPTRHNMHSTCWSRTRCSKPQVERPYQHGSVRIQFETVEDQLWLIHVSSPRKHYTQIGRAGNLWLELRPQHMVLVLTMINMICHNMVLPLLQSLQSGDEAISPWDPSASACALSW